MNMTQWIYFSKTEKIAAADQLAVIVPPVFRVEMQIIPSWNDYIGRARHQGAAAGFIQKWREAGAKAAIQAADKAGIAILRYDELEFTEKGNEIKKEHAKFWTPFIFTPAELVIRFWRPDFTTYDVLNPCVKPIIDGFVDVGLLAKDSVDILRKAGFEFMGVDSSLKLSKQAIEDRKIKRKFSKQPMPRPCRFWFDFYLSDL